jgi:hypothetical protein
MRKHFTIGFIGIALFAVAAVGGEPAVLHPDGPYADPATGMKYPAAVGKFQRTEIAISADGQVKAVYLLATPAQEVLVTVTVFKPPQITFVGDQMPQEMVDAIHKGLCLQNVEDSIKKEAADAVQAEDVPASLSHGWSSYDGYKKGYTLTRADFVGRAQVPVRADVYRFCYIKDIWTVEYRFDYPQGYDASKEVKAFMHDLELSL